MMYNQTLKNKKLCIKHKTNFDALLWDASVYNTIKQRLSAHFFALKFI